MKEFRDKVAVITGTASGIGYGLAERCAKKGMKVVLAGINQGTLEKAEKEIKKTGVTTLVVKTDVSKAEDVQALAQKTIDAFGVVHLLFNNAGIVTLDSVWGSSMADWEWNLSVNLWGVIHGVHFFVPIMIEQGTECHIINTASAVGLLNTAQSGIYGVIKNAIVALSETLYRELEPEYPNIGVSVLCPWIVKSRILESDRNRPIALINKPGEGLDMSDQEVQVSLQLLKRLHESGMSPKSIADLVFSAIKEKKFYILPDSEIFKPMIKARLKDIVQERNPTNVHFNLE